MPEPYQVYKKPLNPTASENEVPLEIGMMGFSLEDINKGKRGICVMPLGARDSTKWGGRKWVRVKLTAMEEVRANRDIIIADEQSRIKEHTPVELSYERHTGGYQRVGENYPLPVTAGSRPVTHFSKVVTAQGFTALIAPATPKKIRVHWYSMSNAHAADTSVGLSFANDTLKLKERYYLAAQGGAVAPNIIDAPWEGAAAESLYAYLSVACADGVYFNIAYTEE